ncbi:MAG: hypothetical protein N2690_11670 [Rhodocyclaceae bacterium]|nr:hypothetical protein [Rhodocyclaceae bacterium]
MSTAQSTILPARAIKAVLKQGGVGSFQRGRFDTHRHEGYTPFSKSWRQTTIAYLLGGILRRNKPSLPTQPARDKTKFTERTSHLQNPRQEFAALPHSVSGADFFGFSSCDRVVYRSLCHDLHPAARIIPCVVERIEALV